MSKEIAIAFQCERTPLIGIVHYPENPAPRGVLAIVAGGPQYRGGCCRQLVEMARTLASAGVPVMRFDYRGLGDSEGPFLGFEDVGADISAAISAFRRQIPELQEIVLWGGCDAASAAIINAWRFPEVTGMILGNPWVHSEETQTQVLIKHYYWKRFKEKAFWRKLLTFRFNPLPAIATITSAAGNRLSLGKQSSNLQEVKGLGNTQTFIERMRSGMSQFHGDLLLLMSGRSLVSKEFDELIRNDSAWRKAMKAPRTLRRHDIPDADQAFSSVAARREVIQVTKDWLTQHKAPSI